MNKKVDIGRIIKEKREQRGMTQAELALSSGLSPSFINRLESGKRLGISIMRLKGISMALNVPINNLIEEIQDPDCDLSSCLKKGATYQGEKIEDEIVDLISMVLNNSIADIQIKDAYKNEILSITLERW